MAASLFAVPENPEPAPVSAAVPNLPAPLATTIIDSPSRQFIQFAPPGLDEKLIALWLHGRCRNTQLTYSADVARWRKFSRVPLAMVTLADLQAFADSLVGLAPRTRGRILSAMKSLLAFSHKIGALPFNVGAALELPRAKDGLAERILEESATHALIRLEKRPRDRVLLRLLYVSGVRVSEVHGLRWADSQANGDEGQLTIYGKGEKTRWIRIPAWDWEDLCRHRNGAAPTDPIFRSRQGGPLSVRQIQAIVRRAARAAGIELNVSPHWLRHAHASHALDRGAPIHLVQATLGHANIATTGRYLHVRPKESSGRFLAR